jgi:hypothetical protein
MSLFECHSRQYRRAPDGAVRSPLGEVIVLRVQYSNARRALLTSPLDLSSTLNSIRTPTTTRPRWPAAASRVCARRGLVRPEKPGQARVYASDGSEFTAGQSQWMHGQVNRIGRACSRVASICRANATQTVLSRRRLPWPIDPKGSTDTIVQSPRLRGSGVIASAG